MAVIAIGVGHRLGVMSIPCVNRLRPLDHYLMASPGRRSSIEPLMSQYRAFHNNFVRGDEKDYNDVAYTVPWRKPVKEAEAQVRFDRSKLQRLRAVDSNLPTILAPLAKLKIEYEHRRNECIYWSRIIAESLSTSSDPEIVMASTNMELFLLKEVCRWDGLSMSLERYIHLKTATCDSNSFYISRVYGIRYQYCGEHFHEAVNGYSKILSILLQSRNTPSVPGVVMSLCDIFPQIEVSKQQIKVKAVSRLKGFERDLNKAIPTVLTYDLVYHGNLFLMEYNNVHILLLRSVSLIRSIRQELRDLNYLARSYRTRSGRDGPEHHYSRLLISDRLTDFVETAKIDMSEYMECLAERLSHYQDIADKHPEDLPIIKSHLTTLEKMETPSLADVQRIQNNVIQQRRFLGQMKTKLLRLLEFIAQFEYPQSQLLHKKRLGYFLSLRDGQRPALDLTIKPKPRLRSPSIHPDAVVYKA